MTADEFAAELEQSLGAYNKDVNDALDRAGERCGKDTNSVIKKHCKFKGDKYIRAFRLERVKDSSLTSHWRWYVKAPYYRLTHLLENGHAKRNGGGRTTAYPHISHGEEFARENYEEYAKEELEKIET